ncbi:MAG: hypothetical protein UY48_C0003G0110 [Candidatus Gottesmanbacteria bacterium GW2011_GWB1_49_7]|uniref:Uncharacterized protein n=1 Tax=Candidatus Gottesmanbacteria bacterium GW2011_GWB1_49_7 TaxID=1618448 RepID=A0A0G1W3L2_9BACT|nr:MAG: hypothetical protein UY48_C0003G0110 [Candidatus Gottesmanbacteria bacterium GW2011_GWB1_49_7]
MAEAAAQIPEPFNVHAWLVKPSGFGAGVTFTQDRKLLVLEAEWEWLAKGGSGPAMFKVEGDLGDPDTYVTDGWEIILDLRLQPEVNYTRWYRGRIVDVKAAVVASKTVTSIRVQGQWASEATAVKLDNDYTAGNQDVKTIIGDILDNQGVDTETRIVYDASLIAASTYTPATFDAVGSASRVIAALAETQGSREFDIDPDTRKFRMAAEVTTVPERNVYIVGKDVKELDSGDAHDRGTNTILVTGRNDGGQARTEEVSDATDQTAYGKKMRHVILPYMSAAADLTQWANNQISDLKGRQEYSIFEIPDVQSRVEGTAPPIGNIKLWRRKSDGTSEAVSLPLHKVRYSFGVACDADYDMPDCTPGEIRPRGRTIKAMVFIGNPPPNIPEWNEKIELEKERISIWIWQGQNPDKYAGDPNSNLPEGRQWTEKLVANTVAKDLYMCTDTTGPVFVRIGGQNLAFKDEANAFTQENSFGSQKLTSVADPTSAQDAATKAYVDAVAIGIDWKPSVRVATTANITLSGEPQTIDGVSVVTGDRVLVKNQTAGAENGIYVVATGAWTRATDADTSAEVTSGIGVTVSEGSTLADTGWMLTTNDPITLGTTALVFTLFGTSLTAFARTLLDDTTDVQALVTLGAAALNVAQTFAGLQTFGDGIATGNVAEAVVGAGVTVDGCLIQDGVAANAGLLDGLDSLAFLKADGTVNLTGNLAVTAGVTIDGYDLTRDAGCSGAVGRECFHRRSTARERHLFDRPECGWNNDVRSDRFEHE